MLIFSLSKRSSGLSDIDIFIFESIFISGIEKSDIRPLSLWQVKSKIIWDIREYKEGALKPGLFLIFVIKLTIDAKIISWINNLFILFCDLSWIASEDVNL